MTGFVTSVGHLVAVASGDSAISGAGKHSRQLLRRGAMMIRYCAARASLGFLLAACAVGAQGSPNANARALGAPSALGDGTVAGYAEFDASGAVSAIGVVFSNGALDNLPAAPSDGHHCFDLNKDGKIDLATECAGWHERVLALPSEASRQPDLPFKWALLNWEPHGHIPPGVYDKPHFDVHFYIEPIEKVFAIESGPCGPEHVRCDQFTQARLPVPANYMNPDFTGVDAVAPAMGDHLVDLKAPEFNGVPFTHTWIYGVYEGHVTFYEEMVTVAYLKSRPDGCSPIKKAAAVALAGRYPTLSCIRYRSTTSEVAVSLEGFEQLAATPPAQ